MYFLARALDGDLEAFAEQYEPIPERRAGNEDEGIEQLLGDLRQAEHAVVGTARV